MTDAVEITCASATGDNGSADPPACVIAARGTKGAVAIGKTVGSTGAFTVILTCNGQEALACTARIDE